SLTLLNSTSPMWFIHAERLIIPEPGAVRKDPRDGRDPEECHRLCPVTWNCPRKRSWTRAAAASSSFESMKRGGGWLASCRRGLLMIHLGQLNARCCQCSIGPGH